MKKLVLVLFILNINFIFAYSINLDYPEKVAVGDEIRFTLKITDFPSGLYDVKIDIIENEARISKILDNGKWKSTFYYINQIIEPGEEKEFILKIEKDFKEADITVRIRSDSGNAKIFDGYKIKKEIKDFSNNKEATSQPQEQVKETQETESVKEEFSEEPKNNEKQTEKIQTEKTTNQITQEKTEKIQTEKIVLNAKDIKTENDKDYSIKGTSWFLGMFSFLLLVILLLILKKENKEDGII